jgi:hypothetical protein
MVPGISGGVAEFVQYCVLFSLGKKKQGHADYEPLVKVNTSRIKDKIEIKVEDNGNGFRKTWIRSSSHFLRPNKRGRGRDLD